jgi:hypothetical protein
VNVLSGKPECKSDAKHFGEKPLIDRRDRQLVAIRPAQRRRKYFPQEILP